MDASTQECKDNYTYTLEKSTDTINILTYSKKKWSSQYDVSSRCRKLIK